MRNNWQQSKDSSLASMKTKAKWQTLYKIIWLLLIKKAI